LLRSIAIGTIFGALLTGAIVPLALATPSTGIATTAVESERSPQVLE
jgi:hypothetical protein